MEGFSSKKDAESLAAKLAGNSDADVYIYEKVSPPLVFVFDPGA